MLMRGSRPITDVPHRKAELSQNVRISVGLAREELDFEPTNSRNFLVVGLDQSTLRVFLHDMFCCW